MAIVVLSIGSENGLPNDERLSYCGANFCGQNLTGLTDGTGSGTASDKPDEAKIDLLSGILLGFALLATVIIAFLVDPLSRFVKPLERDEFK